MKDGKENTTLTKEQSEEQMRQRMEERRAVRAEQKKALEAKKARQEKAQKKIGLAVTIALGVIVVLSLLFLTAQSLGNVTFSRISDGIIQVFSNLKPGPGYPVQVGKNNVLRTETFGDDLVLLENGSLLMLNATAKEVVSYPNTFSSPRLSVSNSRLLLSDCKTGRYALLGGSGLLYEGEIQNTIYACAIGNSGDYAFSTKSDKSASLVSFYDAKDNSKRFDFKCAEEYIIGISFSANGKKAALIGIGTKDALDYSKLYLISLTEQKVINEFLYDGIRLHTVFYSDKNTVVTGFKNGYSVIRNEKDRKDHLLSGGSISHFAVDSRGSFAFAVNGYSDEAGSTVCAYDSKGNEQFTADLTCKVTCFDFQDGRIAASGSDGKVYLIRSDNDKNNKSKAPQNASEKIAVINKTVYSLGNGTIEKIKF